MQQVIDELFEVTEGKAIITTDVGQHQMWAAQFYKNDEPWKWISSGGAGTMGFGFRPRLAPSARTQTRWWWRSSATVVTG